LRRMASKNWRSEGYIQFPDLVSEVVVDSAFDGIEWDVWEEERARGMELVSRSWERGRRFLARGVDCAVVV
jgi:hypothetical protein